VSADGTFVFRGLPVDFSGSVRWPRRYLVRSAAPGEVKGRAIASGRRA
jgi:hypothetical protein